MTADRGPGTGMPPPLRVLPRRGARRWRTAGAVVVAVLVAAILHSLWVNPRLDKQVVLNYLFRDLTLSGLAVTLYLTVLAMLFGIVGGTLLAVMRISKNRVLSTCANLYLWVFRGTPVLIQIIFWGYLGALYPRFDLGIPFTDVVFASVSTDILMTPMVAALLALGLNEAAYASEIVRAGILGVDRGQIEAASSLGMNTGQTLRRVILPQAMRSIIPPMGNEAITMLKTTALVSVIAGKDLLTNLQQVYSQNFQVIPLLIVASIWYMAVTSVLTLFQAFLERRYGRGTADVGSRGTAGRLFGIARWKGLKNA
ncbi:amino acid ABC transporter permease [Nonomuraea sp. LPB2021202275-12-8]|uniref:amino acid ABC transporter permease n=1 Tax=Nonomuraea sp. LPB2021202275-12-8 TaxID=3120159 RepID=UPI00300C9784